MQHTDALNPVLSYALLTLVMSGFTLFFAYAAGAFDKFAESLHAQQPKAVAKPAATSVAVAEAKVVTRVAPSVLESSAPPKVEQDLAEESEREDLLLAA